MLSNLFLLWVREYPLSVYVPLHIGQVFLVLFAPLCCSPYIYQILGTPMQLANVFNIFFETIHKIFYKIF